MSTLKKCGRLSPVAHGDSLPAAGILSRPLLKRELSTRQLGDGSNSSSTSVDAAAAAQRSRQLAATAAN